MTSADDGLCLRCTLEKMKQQKTEPEGNTETNKCELSSKATSRDVVALVQATLAAMPPCPDCGTHNCLDWFKRYIHWLMAGVMSRYGFMAMFISLLENNDGSIVFDKADLESARDITKLEVSQDENDENALKCEITERASSFGDKPETELQNEMWPEIIDDNPFD